MYIKLKLIIIFNVYSLTNFIKRKFMKSIIVIILTNFMIIGCAKKEQISPELISEVIIENKVEQPIITSPKVVDIDPELVVSKETSSEDIDGEDLQEITEFSEPQTSIQSELDFDQLLPDSVWMEYMTKRGDYLSLIASNEYNNVNEWRRIYQWNIEHWEERGIGPDRDNPNFIFPYRELDLKKPAENAIEWLYDHYTYVVKEGESLWIIAKKEYGDELAWVVLFWDNEMIIENHDGKLLPGMKLKIRSELWPIRNEEE